MPADATVARTNASSLSFSVVYLNRVNRDFAIFRELGFSEFQAEFHAGLVELTVQITHQRIDQSAARALSHILPTPIDALCLTPMVFVPLSVRWIACGQSAFTMSHVFFARATGFQQIGSASKSAIRQNASAHLHALPALSALSCIYISITYFVSLMRHVQSPKNVQPFISAPIQGYVYVLKCSGPLFYLIAATSSSNSFQAS